MFSIKDFFSKCDQIRSFLHFLCCWNQFVLPYFSQLLLKGTDYIFKFISAKIATSKTVNLYLRNRKVDVMVAQQKDKFKKSFRSFFKTCSGLIWNFNQFLSTHEICGKSRASFVENFVVSQLEEQGGEGLLGPPHVKFVSYALQ